MILILFVLTYLSYFQPISSVDHYHYIGMTDFCADAQQICLLNNARLFTYCFRVWSVYSMILMKSALMYQRVIVYLKNLLANYASTAYLVMNLLFHQLGMLWVYSVSELLAACWSPFFCILFFSVNSIFDSTACSQWTAFSPWKCRCQLS